MARKAFTLVELLVVVLIVGILATIVLSAMFQAGEAAKAARTRAQIQKIHNLLVPMWEAYRTRRVAIDYALTTDINIDPTKTPISLQQAKILRANALYETIRMELPDRKSDVVDGPVTINARPALSAAYKTKVEVLTGSSPSLENWTTDNQGSECLYLILSRIQDGETNGLEFFKDTEIGDLDDDKVPEILDGWGTPIRLLRWAPGFIDGLPGVTSTLQSGTDPDPFDPYGVRGRLPARYKLFPLVMSAGPDKQWDIAFDGATAVQYSTTAPPNDPFGLPVTLGQPDDNNGNNGGTPQEHVDNIHNHFMDS